MITVHHLEDSRSHRILWLLEELECDYDITHYERDPKTQLAPDSLKAIHPLGKAPVVTDGDHTWAESGAIIEAILDRYDDHKLRPTPDSPALDRYRFWLHYAEGSAMNPLFLTVIFREIPRQAPWIARPLLSAVSKAVHHSYIYGELKSHLQFWEDHLQEHAFFAGQDFTAADIQMGIPLEGAASTSIGFDDYPHVAEHLQTLRQRPAYQRALQKGGGLNFG